MKKEIIFARIAIAVQVGETRIKHCHFLTFALCL